LRYAFCKYSKVFIQHALARPKSVHALEKTNRPQRPPKQQSSESCYDPVDAVTVPRQEALHGSSSRRCAGATTSCRKTAWSAFILGCGRQAAPCLCGECIEVSSVSR